MDPKFNHIIIEEREDETVRGHTSQCTNVVLGQVYENSMGVKRLMGIEATPINMSDHSKSIPGVTFEETMFPKNLIAGVGKNSAREM